MNSIGSRISVGDDFVEKLRESTSRSLNPAFDLLDFFFYFIKLSVFHTTPLQKAVRASLTDARHHLSERPHETQNPVKTMEIYDSIVPRKSTRRRSLSTPAHATKGKVAHELLHRAGASSVAVPTPLKGANSKGKPLIHNEYFFKRHLRSEARVRCRRPRFAFAAIIGSSKRAQPFSSGRFCLIFFSRYMPDDHPPRRTGTARVAVPAVTSARAATASRMLFTEVRHER